LHGVVFDILIRAFGWYATGAAKCIEPVLTLANAYFRPINFFAGNSINIRGGSSTNGRSTVSLMPTEAMGEGGWATFSPRIWQSRRPAMIERQVSGGK